MFIYDIHLSIPYRILLNEKEILVVALWFFAACCFFKGKSLVTFKDRTFKTHKNFIRDKFFSGANEAEDGADNFRC